MNTFLNSGIDATHLALEKKLKLCRYAGRQFCINMIIQLSETKSNAQYSLIRKKISHTYMKVGFCFIFCFGYTTVL